MHGMMRVAAEGHEMGGANMNAYVGSTLAALAAVALTCCPEPLLGRRTLGKPASAEVIDDLVASGCGQFCTTQGQGLCQQSIACHATLVNPLNIPCTSPGAACGACFGAQEIVCGGTLAMNGELCFEYSTACCTPPGACTTTPVLIPDPNDIDGPPLTQIQCVCTGATNVKSGIRIMCSMDYAYPQCNAQ